ncbi:MAG: helix-turn-helix domain-containing protein [Gemmatimonadota bacterium]|jgi:DeoR family suf operon transcriptional repressor|nr:helix-turn-helix domain-containing protein [Gemmatimonadota bacterium]MDQ8173688.1 helix-turn-helix domain-containing protein [Gemmatimonadota bacterium]
MQDVIGALGGFRGVRADLLVALKKAQPLTAHELGQQFGLTANGLRRYLKALEEDGLVRYERAVHGVGAPVFAYSLTPAGEALFPRSYVSVLATALDALRAGHGSAAVAGVLESDWNRLADEAGPVLEALPLVERVPLVAELLTAKGYMAEAVQLDRADGEPGMTALRIHNCAVGEIAEQFPEACAAEAKFVERLLGVPLVQRAHRRDGCGRCEYGVMSHHLAETQEQA